VAADGDQMSAVQATLDELIELGGPHLAGRTPAIAELRRLSAEPRSAETVARMQEIASVIYGGYGSFADYGIPGADGERFERAKDTLLRQIGRL
jgi:hypothetical protein